MFSRIVLSVGLRAMDDAGNAVLADELGRGTAAYQNAQGFIGLAAMVRTDRNFLEAIIFKTWESCVQFYPA